CCWCPAWPGTALRSWASSWPARSVRISGRAPRSYYCPREHSLSASHSPVTLGILVPLPWPGCARSPMWSLSGRSRNNARARHPMLDPPNSLQPPTQGPGQPIEQSLPPTLLRAAPECNAPAAVDFTLDDLSQGFGQVARVNDGKELKIDIETPCIQI